MPEPAESRTLKTTTVSLEILRQLMEHDGMRVSRLAESLDRPKSTVHGHLATLQSKEFVIKEGDLYFPGPELLRLGNYVHTRKEGYLLAEEYVERMFEGTGNRSIFVAQMGGRAVFIHSTAGDRTKWQHERIGNRLYMHSTAVGKAMLAEMSRDHVRQILDRWGMPKETSQTITSEEELFDELEQIRSRGYAFNRGENFEDLRAVGVAAVDAEGNTIGAFSVSGPKRVFGDADNRATIGDHLTQLVEEFELQLALS